MQAELVSFGIDLFDLEDEVQGAAKDFSGEVDGLAYGGWTFWLSSVLPGRAIEPLGIAFPLYEVPPDHLDRRRDDCGGTDCQTHSMLLLSMRSRQLLGGALDQIPFKRKRSSLYGVSPAHYDQI